MVELVGAKTDLRRVGIALARALPVPRRAHARRSRSTPRSKLYHCFGCQRGRRRDRLRAGGRRGSTSRRRSRRSPSATTSGSSARTTTREAEKRRRRRERLLALLDRTARFYASYLWDSDEAAKARDYLAERGLRRGGAEGVPRGLCAQGLGPRAGRSRPARRLSPAGAASTRAWRSATRAAASTTASAGGSCSRWRTLAGGCSASAPGRCPRAAGRST